MLSVLRASLCSTGSRGLRGNEAGSPAVPSKTGRTLLTWCASDAGPRSAYGLASEPGIGEAVLQPLQVRRNGRVQLEMCSPRAVRGRVRPEGGSCDPGEWCCWEIFLALLSSVLAVQW